MKSDKITGIFWLIFGFLLSQQSCRLNLGGFHRPGSGLFPFLIGLFIAAASCVLLIQSWLNKSAGKKDEKKKIHPRSFFLCLLFLYLYAFVFEWLGYVPSTFLLIFCLLKIVERKSWITVVITALLTSITSYLFFETLLHAALPRGLFGI